MKCISCNKEYKAKRNTSKYCSARCRKLAFQGVGISVPDKGDSVTENAKISVSKDAKEISVSKINFDEYDAQDLCFAINSYKHDEWIDSPEFKELESRLEIINVEELKERGYFIPARLL